MRKFYLLLLAVAVFTGSASAQKPTKQDITAVMKQTWESEAIPKKSVTIRDIKIGTSEKSNYAQQLEGLPKGALVTHAKIDWDLTTFYTSGNQVTRRITTAWVYKDQFGEWAVMNIGTVYPK
jgi:hypothetical protein